MKKFFITGLVILLPLALTISIVMFIFNILTIPFLGFVKEIFDRYHLFEKGFFLLHPDQLQNFIAQFLILICLFFIVIGLGFVGHWFFFKAFMKFAEYIVRKIPLVSSIYKTCQDVIQTLFSSKTTSFKQVVLVPFPNAHTHSLGLITQEEISSLENSSLVDSVAVFIPTAPNPTSGFLIMVKRSQVTYLDMTVENAFKYVISCGVVAPVFRGSSSISNSHVHSALKPVPVSDLKNVAATDTPIQTIL